MFHPAMKPNHFANCPEEATVLYGVTVRVSAEC